MIALSNKETAKIVNDRLGVEIFDENFRQKFFTKKEIQRLLIDDLINPDTKYATTRLNKFVAEILKELK